MTQLSRKAWLDGLEGMPELTTDEEIALYRRLRAHEMRMARQECPGHHVQFARKWHRKLMALKWPLDMDGSDNTMRGQLSETGFGEDGRL